MVGAVDLIWAAVVILAYALLSKRLAGTGLTMPIFLVTTGLLLGPRALGFVNVTLEGVPLEVIVEMTLALVLFTDAVRIDLKALRREASVPSRLLGIGLPLTIAAGTLAAAPLFPELTLPMMALLAASLAPTDAALGQAVILDRSVPQRIRQGLNVESGLNDGLVVPVVVVLIEVVKAEAASGPDHPFFVAMYEQIGYGLLAGAAIGAAVGWLLLMAARVESSEEAWRRIAVLITPVAAFIAADAMGGSGFIAAYTAGIAFGVAGRDRSAATTAFADEAGELLNALTWFLFGAVLLSDAWTSLTWQMGAYAVLSLTAVRMVPVAVAMLGTRARPQTLAFLGWFGPRGLASLAFALIILDDHIAGGNALFTTICGTVALSVYLHGVTSAIGARRYGAWFQTHPRPSAMEAEDVSEQRPRGSAR